MSPHLVLNQLEVTNTKVSNAFLGSPYSKLDNLQHAVLLNNDMWLVHAGRGDLLLVPPEEYLIVPVMKSLKMNFQNTQQIIHNFIHTLTEWNAKVIAFSLNLLVSLGLWDTVPLPSFLRYFMYFPHHCVWLGKSNGSVRQS